MSTRGMTLQTGGLLCLAFVAFHRQTSFSCASADTASLRVPDLVAKFESQAVPQDKGQYAQTMQRSSKDVPEGRRDSSSSSRESERLGVLARAVSADDGALKKAALQVQKDLAGVEIPEVTSVAALSAAATAPIGSTPLAAGQDTPATADTAQVETSRLSPALLRALDAETETKASRQSGVPASLSVQPADSRRGTGDSVAEPMPATAYAGKPQPSRFAASPQKGPGPAAPESESSSSDASEGYPNSPRRTGAAIAPGKDAGAEAMGLTVAVKAAERMRTVSDSSQNMESPSSARPLLAGPSTAVPSAPGPVHVSPKGSVIGFMPVPASQHPLHGEDDSMVRRLHSAAFCAFDLCLAWQALT